MRVFVAVLAVLAGVGVCSGRIISVDDDGPADFSTIQAAIDDANDGDTVEIQAGTYTGEGNRDIDFLGKAITVRSTDPDDWAVVRATVIDCQSLGRGFYFHSGEDANSVLGGLTITKGRDWGGAIRISNSSPLIANCAMTDNLAPLVDDMYGDGGAILCGLGSPTVKGCIFSGNIATGMAGAASFYKGAPIIENCTIIGNSGWDGGGAFFCVDSLVTIRNSILRGNTSGDRHSQIFLGGVFSCATLTISYSDVEGGEGEIEREGCTYINWGAGNIDADPCFADPGYWDENGTPSWPDDDVWVEGEYHLKSQAGRWDLGSETWVTDDVTSLCIDAGDPMTPVGPEPFPNGGIINMGAYGGTIEASKSYFGGPPCETIIAGDINGDCIIDFRDFWFMALHWLDTR